jgi:hypothetical protein
MVYKSPTLYFLVCIQPFSSNLIVVFYLFLSNCIVKNLFVAVKSFRNTLGISLCVIGHK